MAGRLGRDRPATSPTTISPVVPEIEITSPSCTVVPPADELLRRAGRSSSASAPQIAGLPMPRATTAAWRHEAAARREDAFGRDHAVQVVGRRLGPHEDHAAPPPRACASASSAVKYTLPTAAPGDALRPLASTVERRLRVELRVQQLVELRGLHAQHRFALVDQALVVHLDRHAQRGRGGALADARLQHEQATLLDRELDVAHVAVVVLEQLHHVEQLLVAARGSGCAIASSGSVMRMPATTSSPCALVRKSP